MIFCPFFAQVLVYLQLCKYVSLVFLDDWEEVTNHVCAITKALSKRPFKYESSPVFAHKQEKKVKLFLSNKNKLLAVEM